jgi:hypothetical protein
MVKINIINLKINSIKIIMVKDHFRKIKISIYFSIKKIKIKIIIKTMQTVVIRIIFQGMIIEMKKFLITMRTIKNIGQHVLIQNKLIQNFVPKIIKKM